MSKSLLWTLGIVGAAALCVCTCGTSWVIEVPAYLLIGWGLHLYRLSGEVAIDWPAVGTGIVASILLTIGLHLLGRWLYQSMRPGQLWSWRWSLCLTSILFLSFVAGIAAIGLSHQAIWFANTKEPIVARLYASPRTISINYLKQIGLATHGYHDAHKQLPAGATFDDQGRALHGWETMLLPYLEQGPLFRKIDLAKPWDAMENAPAMREELSAFMSPLVEDGPQTVSGYGVCHYATNVHVMGTKSMTLRGITDGASNTMLAGDVASNFKPWGMPANWRDPALGLLTSPHSFGGPHPKTSLILLCDGTVRTVKHDISIDVMKALATPNGGEKLDFGDLK
ncbi:MAG TPA: DUF1559 domain-containing protein [Gemmataceae bacterium]|nr:DUF1559 domain-containing protein [Gemmataceae bacterium]